MPPKVLPDLCLVLTFLRRGQGWSQTDLASAAGISPNLLNDYEHGRKKLTRARLEHLVSFMGLPPDRIDATLACLQGNRASSRAAAAAADRFGGWRQQIDAVSGRVAALAEGFARSALSLLTVEGEALHARQQAEFLWQRLQRHPHAQRIALVEDTAKYRTWALCERVAKESIALAPNHPKQALEMAELARLIAELVPGDALWRSRLQGYAWAHVSNARRVCNDLPGADTAMARAWKLWEAGAAGDPGLLNDAWLPWIEAALRRDQRRFPEALKRIEEALALETGELRGKILLSKSAVLEILGDSEASMAALSEAARWIDPDRGPRNAFGLRFNLLAGFCQLGRAAEAEPQLPEVRALAERLGEELDLTRVVWLEGKVAAGLGRQKQARAAFEQARRAFMRRELAFDYALVSLELALLLLEEERTREVSDLAEEMLWIFRAQGIEREALAALRLFCDAAQQETATADLARRVVKFLYRAQYDPELPFEPGGRAEAR